MLFLVLLKTALSQTSYCGTNLLGINKFSQITVTDPASWNYNDLTKKCTAYLNTNYSVTNTLTIDTTNTVLTGQKILLEYLPNDTVTLSNTTLPFQQYQIGGLKLRVQSLGNPNQVYNSLFFEFRDDLFELDTQNQKTQFQELHVVFQLSSTYQSSCPKNTNIDPQYAVLVFKLINDPNYKAPLNFTTGASQSNFNFRKQITSQIANLGSTYYSFKMPLTYAPCNMTQYFLVTQPLFYNGSSLNIPTTTTSGIIAISNVDFQKGRFIYFEDDQYKYVDEVTPWAATWAASVAPCLFLAFVSCVYGSYRLSNIGRYQRPDSSPEGENQGLVQPDKEIEH
ncbi:hypothetical protein pb186bvf_012075 [Paramecium bursaria]